jgi:predicted TIM-barrel fold metal-dependent hydrolase
MIIDAHIHMFRPDQMPGADPDYLSKLPTYLRLLFTPTPYNHTRQGWATCDRMIEIMDEEGIARVTVLGPEDDYTAKCYNQYPNRLLPFKYLDMPALRKNRREELLRMRRFIEEEGFVGFGEHHPDPAGYELTDPDVLAVMDLACELGVPVNLHVSEPVGHFYYGKSHNSAEEFLWLIERYPDLRFIFSHWGGGIAFYEAIPEMRAVLKNVHYDVTASKLFFDVQKSMEQIIKIVDPAKIFYGSDFPILLHPDEYPDELNPRFIVDRHDFLKTNVPDEILDGIMGLNFAKFLGLSPDDNSGKPHLRLTPAPVPNERPYFAGKRIEADSSVFLAAFQYPATRPVFEKHGIRWRDQRLPPWLPTIQPLAQHGIWFEYGFMDEVRAALPAGDALRDLNDLDLAHVSLRRFGNEYPKVRELLASRGILSTDSPTPAWETVEQAAASKGMWPPAPILDELNAAAGLE